LCRVTCQHTFATEVHPSSKPTFLRGNVVVASDSLPHGNNVDIVSEEVELQESGDTILVIYSVLLFNRDLEPSLGVQSPGGRSILFCIQKQQPSVLDPGAGGDRPYQHTILYTQHKGTAG
jgi:hypothetical protein